MVLDFPAHAVHRHVQWCASGSPTLVAEKMRPLGHITEPAVRDVAVVAGTIGIEQRLHDEVGWVSGGDQWGLWLGVAYENKIKILGLCTRTDFIVDVSGGLGPIVAIVVWTKLSLT